MKTIRIIQIVALMGLAVLLLSACGTGGEVEPAKESYTVGILNITPSLESVINGFKDGMAERGYVEGENITYLYEGVGVLTTEDFVEAGVDLIYSTNTVNALDAQAVTDTVPILFNLTTDPVSIGLVESVGSPGGNITGVMAVLSDAKRLELLTQMVPEIKRVLVPNEPNRPQTVAVLEALRPVAEKLGLELVVVDTLDEDAIAELQQNLPEDIDAIFLLGSGGSNPAATSEWSLAAIENGLPISAEFDRTGKGPLMCYGTNPYEVGKQSVELVDAILQGRSPAELPVLTADLYLTINLATADAIGIEVPDDILGQATFVKRSWDE